MTPAAIKGEIAVPVMAGAVGWAGFLTDSFILLSVLPALGGAFYSVYMSWARHRIMQDKRSVTPIDWMFALASSAFFGVIFGWWLASMMPGDERAALCFFTFLGSLIGTKALRSVHQMDWDFGAWFKSVLEGVATAFSKKGGE